THPVASLIYTLSLHDALPILLFMHKALMLRGIFMERTEEYRRREPRERHYNDEEDRGWERPPQREQQGYFRGQAGYENEPFGYEYEERGEHRAYRSPMDEREGYRRESE